LYHSVIFMENLDVVKHEAIELRRKGLSIREIENKLKVSRSTLSIWLRKINLTRKQKEIMQAKRLNGLAKARGKAALYHKEKKRQRLDLAQRRARQVLADIDIKEKNVLKLALSMLFAGEGFKVAEETSLGNSDPRIVKVFLKLLDIVYGVNKNRLRLYLHLRADQGVIYETNYWSNVLEIEAEYFKIAPVDKRTVGKKTYSGYHGVCVVRYYDVSIKRELLEIANNFYYEL